MPKPAPFSISPDAADYVLDRITTLPPGVQPVIIMETKLGEPLDAQGKKIRWCYEGENFIVGYFDPAEKPTTEQIGLLGRTISITPEALRTLSGRTLALRRVDAPYGFVKDTRNVLIATSPSERVIPLTDDDNSREKEKEFISRVAFSVLGGFGGMGVVWIAVAIGARVLRVRDDRFLNFVFPILIVGGVIGAITSFTIFRKIFEMDERRIFAYGPAGGQFTVADDFGFFVSWGTFLGIPAPFVVLSLFLFQPLSHVVGQSIAPYFILGICMAILAICMILAERIRRRIIVRLGVLGWLLTIAFGYWFFKFHGP